MNLQDRSRNAGITLGVVAALICAVLVIAFWPGVGTYEVMQFAQQRKLPIMNDWKSPFVAGIYWLSDDFFKSTGPILLVQQALFWSGLALLAQSTIKSTARQVLFLLIIFVLPPIWITEILLWKEAWTLSFLSFGIGAIFAYLKNGRVWYGLAAILSAILLTATRHNSVFLTLPVFYIAAQTLSAKMPQITRKKRRAIHTTAFIFLMVVALGVTWAVNKKGKQHCHIWHQVLLWDLAAVSVSEGQMLIPDVFRKTGEAGSLARLQSYFTHYNSDPLFFYNGSPLRLFGTAWSGCDERPPLAMLLESWLDAILSYPRTYLHHRFVYLLHLLNFQDVAEDKFGRAYYRIDSEFSPIANRSKLFERIRTNPIFEAVVLGIPIRGGIYPIVFLLAVIGLPRKRAIENTCIWMLWFAGLAYFASFVVIGSGAVMRYLSVYALLGPAILAARWGGAATSSRA